MAASASATPKRKSPKETPLKAKHVRKVASTALVDTQTGEAVLLPPEKKHKGGARGKYAPAVVETICKALELGETYKYACIAAGITFETFNEWRSTKPEFSAAIEKAQAAFRRRNLERIEKAASRGWLAAAWLLERRHPEDWGRRTVEVTGANGGAIQFEAAGEIAQAVRSDPSALTEVQRVIVTLVAERERKIAS